MCTTTRAKKVVASLSLFTLVSQAVIKVSWPIAVNNSVIDSIYLIYTIMLRSVVPLAVLIINAIVVREVRRRASSDAASNLGLQHQQSTSSNSAVPTVMLVTTSLVYVLPRCSSSIFCTSY